jgi:hypothetical protein
MISGKGAVKVQALIGRNINAEPIQVDEAKLPLERPIEIKPQGYREALGVALGFVDSFRGQIERPRDRKLP